MAWRKPKIIDPQTGYGYEIRSPAEPTFKR